MADTIKQTDRPELHDARSRREGHRQGELRGRLPRRRHAVRQAARSARMPHARVTRLDTSAALAMPGVKAILTADDLPGAGGRRDARRRCAGHRAGRARSDDEPLYQGEPILAVAAVDETTAAEAIETIDIEFEPLPFVVDPIESLRPGGPNARSAGQRLDAADRCRRRRPARAVPATTRAAPARHRRRRGAGDVRRSSPAAERGAPPATVPRRGARRRRGGTQLPAAPAARLQPLAHAAGAAAGARARTRRGGAPRGALPPPQIAVWKWTDEDFENAGDGQMPMGKATDEWTFGNVDDGAEEGRSRARRNVHDPVDRAPAARNAHGDGLLAERQAVSCTARRRARCRPSRRSRAGPASRPTKVVHHQRIHRRRLRQQDSGRHLDGDPGAALEESQRAGDDAHHPRRRALHRPRASGHPRARRRSASARTAGSPRSTCTRSATTARTTRRATGARRARRCRWPTSRKRCAGAG